MWNPSAWPGVLAERLKIKGDSAMRDLSPGVWTCAALYVAIGLLGILFLASGPGVPHRAKGMASPQSLRRRRCVNVQAAALGRSQTVWCHRRRLRKLSGTDIFDTRMKSTATEAVMSATV